MFIVYNKTCDYSRVNKSQVKILFLGCPNQKSLTAFLKNTTKKVTGSNKLLDVQALAPTIILKFYLMSFHFIQKENLIQENKALSLRFKIIII